MSVVSPLPPPPPTDSLPLSALPSSHYRAPPAIASPNPTASGAGPSTPPRLPHPQPHGLLGSPQTPPHLAPHTRSTTGPPHTAHDAAAHVLTHGSASPLTLAHGHGHGQGQGGSALGPAISFGAPIQGSSSFGPGSGSNPTVGGTGGTGIGLGRPSTPPQRPPLLNAPISAPQTPVTPTHLFSSALGGEGMERCRSSSAALTGATGSAFGLGGGGGGKHPHAHTHDTRSHSHPHPHGAHPPSHAHGSGHAHGHGSSSRPHSRGRSGERGREPKSKPLIFRASATPEGRDRLGREPMPEGSGGASTVEKMEQQLEALQNKLKGKADWEHVESAAVDLGSATGTGTGRAAKDEDEDETMAGPSPGPALQKVGLEDVGAVKEEQFLLGGTRVSLDISPASPARSPLEVPADVHPVSAQAEDEPMDVDPPASPAPPQPQSVWGMPAWGRSAQCPEVRPGVRLVGVSELPQLIEQHALLDTPSHVLFPWLHGIADDGQKGRDMAAFFGHYPPFEPPAYRGLCVIAVPPQLSGEPKAVKPQAQAFPLPAPKAETDGAGAPGPTSGTKTDADRDRGSTMSSSSESYRSSGASTDITTPSLGESLTGASGGLNKTSIPEYDEPRSMSHDTAPPAPESATEVQMHPTESKRVSPRAQAAGLDTAQHPLPCDKPEAPGASASASLPGETALDLDSSADSSASSSSSSTDDAGPSCILLNALHLTDIFEISQSLLEPAGAGAGSARTAAGRARARSGRTQAKQAPPARFRPARLPPQINLRNLNIQQIKYATISDLIIYARGGVNPRVLDVAEAIAAAQNEVYDARWDECYRAHAPGAKDQGEEGHDRPVRYGVWVVEQPYTELEAAHPHLVNLTSTGQATANTDLTDLFEREAYESRQMTRATEVLEGLWVGNDCDVPGGADDGAGSTVPFDLCVRASDCCEMPTTDGIQAAYRRLKERRERMRREAERMDVQEETKREWGLSPATQALRNLLSPTGTPLASPVSENPKRAASIDPFTETAVRKRRSFGSSKQPTPPLPTTAGSGPEKKDEHVTLECAGSIRTLTGQTRNLNTMTDKMIELVHFLRRLTEGRERTGMKARVLVHCQDGYTESSLLVLSYIMGSLSCSLGEAYVYLQTRAGGTGRSFFLYGTDKALLRKVDQRLTADRKARAMKLVQQAEAREKEASAGSGGSGSGGGGGGLRGWKWGLSSFNLRSSSTDSAGGRSSPDRRSRRLSGLKALEINPATHGRKGSPTVGTPAGGAGAGAGAGGEAEMTLESARKMLREMEEGGTEEARGCVTWFEDRRFDGFPSRILDFLFLGNLEHAGNAAMLHAVGITHVVSVGESLLCCPEDCDPMYGKIGLNTLCLEAKAGRIQVLDITDVRDDGNDPLRPLIARASAWIEQARLDGGKVLVHCRVGVSRSASIVMAYLMQFKAMGLMDAYLMTRARRLNVLIQPNLRFFHEMFGWEVELVRREMALGSERRRAAEAQGVVDQQELDRLEKEGVRTIMYSWPSFCRDLHCLNRRFLCN